MAPITIDTKDIVRWITFVVVAVILIVLGALGSIFIFSPGVHIGETSTSIIAPTSTPTAPQYPQLTNIVTISSMTTSGGFPQINIREDSRTFRVDWNTYDDLHIDDVVRFTIIGTESMYGGTVYDSTVEVVYYGSDSDSRVIYGPSVVNYGVAYYHYRGKYYQYDGHRTDVVSWKEVRNQRVIEERPPAVVIEDNSNNYVPYPGQYIGTAITPNSRTGDGKLDE
jgi:hypothetical protein